VIGIARTVATGDPASSTNDRRIASIVKIRTQATCSR